MLKALEKFGSLSDESKFRNWLFSIMTNTYISYYRKHFWNRFLSLNEFDNIEKIPGIFPRTEQNEIHEAVYIAVSELNDKEKTAILLFEIGGFSIEEIKDIQSEKSISAVKSRLSRAREKLKKRITEIENNSKLNTILKPVKINSFEAETVSIINKINPENKGG